MRTLSSASSTLPWQTTCGSYDVFLFEDNSIASFHNSTIHGSFGSANTININSKSSVSFTDCRIVSNRVQLHAGALILDTTATVSILRTLVADNSAGTYGGCFHMGSATTLTIEDSDIVNCRSDGTENHGGGMARIYAEGTTLTILNSRISGSSTALRGSVAHVADGAVLRIAGSTITNSADGIFAVYEATGTEFAIQVLRRDVLVTPPSLFCCLTSHTRVGSSIQTSSTKHSTSSHPQTCSFRTPRGLPPRPFRTRQLARADRHRITVSLSRARTRRSASIASARWLLGNKFPFQRTACRRVLLGYLRDVQ